MKYIAIYKTFKGDEFVIPSLESIYEYMDKIIFIHCDKSWTGKTGNTVKDKVLAWTKENDKAGKIVNKSFVDCDQTTSYNNAWKIAEKIPHDWKLLIDTDEVWDEENLKKLFAASEKVDTDIDAIRVRMHEYIKSPLFRIEPTPPLMPVVLVRNKVKYTAVRCSEAESKGETEIFFHHFTLVRRTLKEIIEKQQACCDIENEPAVDWELWTKHKWNKLPGAFHIKPLANHQQAWAKVKVINIKDLPEPVQKSELTIAFSKYDYSHRYGEAIKPEIEMYKKYNLPEGFNHEHPKYSVPSFRNRYILMMKELTTKGVSNG